MSVTGYTTFLCTNSVFHAQAILGDPAKQLVRKGQRSQGDFTSWLTWKLSQVLILPIISLFHPNEVTVPGSPRMVQAGVFLFVGHVRLKYSHEYA